MKHYDEDKLLEYALGLSADLEERAQISGHLESCPDCQARLHRVEDDLEVIGGVRAKVTTIPLPQITRSRSLVLTFLRVAAMLVCGIVIGYGAARWQAKESVCVSPSYLATAPPAEAQAGLAVSDATDISASYYDLMLSTSTAAK
ncbi:MAG: hypothetical protein ABIJ61_10340 [bacterium]